MEKICKKIELKTIIEIIILVALLIVSFLLCINQYYDHDEFEAVHTSWKVMQGQVIYLDFFQQKPPFFHITMIPLIRYFSDSIYSLYACKIYCYILFLGIVYASFLISKNVFGKSKYLMTILLLSCTFFTDKLTEIRPDTLYIMLIMFSLAFLYKNIKIKKSSLIISAVLAGLSFAVLPKAVFYIFTIFVILSVRALLKKISVKDLIIYFITMGLTLTPFISYFALKSISFQDYWFFNFTINYNFIETFSPLRNIQLIFFENDILYTLGLLGIFCLKGLRQKEIGFIAIFLYLSVFLINVPNKQYYVPAIPFIAMIAANAIKRIRFLDKNIFVILLFALLFPASFFYNNILIKRSLPQISQINYVLYMTNKNDRVYDGSIYFNLFRQDVDYFWFSIRPKGVAETYRMLRPREYDIYKDIEIHKPKIIYTKYLDIENPVIKNNYEPTHFNRMYIRSEQ